MPRRVLVFDRRVIRNRAKMRPPMRSHGNRGRKMNVNEIENNEEIERWRKHGRRLDADLGRINKIIAVVSVALITACSIAVMVVAFTT